TSSCLHARRHCPAQCGCPRALARTRHAVVRLAPGRLCTARSSGSWVRTQRGPDSPRFECARGPRRTPDAGERKSIEALRFDDARLTGIVVVVLQCRAIGPLADWQCIGWIATVLYGQ